MECIGLAINKLKLRSLKGGLYGRYLLTFTNPSYSKKTNNPKEYFKFPENKLTNGDNVGIYKNDLVFDSKNRLLKGLVYKKTEVKIVITVEDN